MAHMGIYLTMKWMRLRPPAITFSSGALPLEIIDNILEYNAGTEWSDLLVCKYWYCTLIKRRVRSVRLSTSMILRMPGLSEDFFDVLKHSTTHLNLSLYRTTAGSSLNPMQAAPTSNSRRPFPSQELNSALKHLLSRLASFHILHSFTLCNHLETEASWGVISMDTFEYFLICLSACRLEYVRIDMPGAPLENRCQLLSLLGVPKGPHVCDIIAQNFPDPRELHLRMRELCPSVFRPYNIVSRLEKLVIHLDLEPEPWHEMDLDDSVVDCRYAEGFGEYLVRAIQPAARTFNGSNPCIKSLELMYRAGRYGQKDRKVKKYRITT